MEELLEASELSGMVRLVTFQTLKLTGAVYCGRMLRTNTIKVVIDRKGEALTSILLWASTFYSIFITDSTRAPTGFVWLCHRTGLHLNCLGCGVKNRPDQLSKWRCDYELFEMPRCSWVHWNLKCDQKNLFGYVKCIRNAEKVIAFYY